MKNPYEKIYHLAAMIASGGQVSPACAKTPRPINMKKESWTISANAVTCPKCRKTERFAKKSAEQATKKPPVAPEVKKEGEG